MPNYFGRSLEIVPRLNINCDARRATSEIQISSDGRLNMTQLKLTTGRALTYTTDCDFWCDCNITAPVLGVCIRTGLDLNL